MTTNEHPTRCVNCRRAINPGDGIKVSSPSGPVYICPDCDKAWRP